jgi:hypothetical protein
MAIQIHLKSIIVIPGLDSDPVVLPAEVRTLRDLLYDVSRRIHFELLDSSSGDLKDDFEIIINNKEIWFHPAGLETQIQNGDTVEIYMVPLGGG